MMWNDKGYWRLSKKQMKKRQKLQIAATLLAVCVVFVVVIAIHQVGNRNRNSQKESASSGGTSTQLPVEPTSLPQATEEASAPERDPEEDIYTFLQGPKSWKRRIDWSGEWGEQYMDGGYFGAFGCGLCCVANIYSSQTPYQCSPVDAYRFAKKNTEYQGGMAIEWGYLRRSLTDMGFDCHVERKPDTYQQFRQQIKKSLCNLVLVSSYDSSVYWKNTPGHYVTIFLYDSEDDTIFLADSGDPDHNRSRVKLKKIYRSLKTSSNWQYITVEGYDKAKDSWRHKKTSGTWNAPEI